MSHPFDAELWRRHFPAFERRVAGRPAVFFDGPAGSQVPREVIDTVSRYLAHTNANNGGAFATSRESADVLRGAHRAVSDLLGANDPDLIAFGPNMTTLTFALSRALARTWTEDDEILVSRLDHDANVTPWVLAARDAGATARHVAIRREDCTLDLDDLRAKLSERTALVAVTAASNAVGTVQPVRKIADLVHRVGATLFVDAVHHAPHRLTDVAAWDADFVACSAYKFFGPHVGVLWGRRELLEHLPAYKVRPASETLPDRWMSGTQNHEGIAGTRAAIDYLAEIGRMASGKTRGRRSALVEAFGAIRTHEERLVKRLLHGLTEFFPDITVFGITDPRRLEERVPTVSFTHARRSPEDIASRLAERGIFVWSGNFYALPLTEALGVEPDGMVRVGLLHYNTEEEVDRLLEALAEL